MTTIKTVTAFNVNTQSRDHSLAWADKDNGRGEVFHYSTFSFDAGELQRAIQALKTQQEVNKLACELGTLQLNLKRAYKEEREQAIDTLLDAKVVTPNARVLGSVKSANQLSVELGRVLEFLAAVYCKMDKVLREGYAAPKAEGKPFFSLTQQQPAGDMSIQEIIKAVTEDSHEVIELDTNRAKNLLELASRKIRKDDNTANWHAVAQLALNYL